MADLELVAGNLHNEHAAVTWLARRGRADAPGHYDAAFVSEAHRRRRRLAGVPGMRYLTGPRWAPSESRETGILLATGLPVLGHGYFHVSDEAARWERVGKARWGQVVVTEAGGEVVHLITVHPVAGPKVLAGDDPDHPLVRRYADAMAWLDAQIAAADTLGHEWVAGGDVQMRTTNTRPWSVRRVLEAHGGRWHWAGIDLVAWSPGLHATHRATHDDFPSDHPALRVALAVNRKRRH